MLETSAYGADQLFIVTDKKCRELCMPVLLMRVPLLSAARVIEIESEEEQKSIESCNRIWQKLTSCFADRNVLIINLGGGIVGDVGGFAASVFKRGIDFINIPTTLLAQVDASIGGKTGVNFEGYKNLIGAFQQPLAVYVFPDFLETLDGRQLRCGFAEMIKHALIADSNYWQALQECDLADVRKIGELVERSIEIKGAVVQSDPREKGQRKLLNFGHTVGHAIESCSHEIGKPLLHGEAIAIGMICESYLSYKFAGLKHERLDEICSFLLAVYQPYSIRSDKYYRLIELMKNDKKNRGNQLCFSLISDLGKGVYDQEIELDDVVNALQFYNEKVALLANLS